MMGNKAFGVSTAVASVEEKLSGGTQQEGNASKGSHEELDVCVPDSRNDRIHEHQC